jgi:hypothetical protein
MTETPAASRPEAGSGVGRYMYAITRGLDPDVLESVTGLRDGRLELVEHQGLAAVVSTVDLEEFGEQGLRRNLENLQWLEEAARRHDAVIQAVATAAPAAPLRLATICLDDAGVRARLAEWYFALEQVLDRVEGRMEWSVKVLTRPKDTRVDAPAAHGSGGAPVGGAEYLRRKKAETEARFADQTKAGEIADVVHAALAEQSVAGRRLPAQDPRLAGHEGTMLLNGAYLVPVEDGDAFAARASELASQHSDVVIDCRGPWPPYSFAMLEQR